MKRFEFREEGELATQLHLIRLLGNERGQKIERVRKKWGLLFKEILKKNISSFSLSLY